MVLALLASENAAEFANTVALIMFVSRHQYDDLNDSKAGVMWLASSSTRQACPPKTGVWHGWVLARPLFADPCTCKQRRTFWQKEELGIAAMSGLPASLLWG